MSINELIQPLNTFYTDNTELSIAIIVTLVIAVLIKPKQIGKILGAVATIVIIGYLIASLSGIVSKGVDKKNAAGVRTDKQYYNSE
ncbi:MAG: hypothetical protein L0Z73_09120 [Gammaproteobacteria bacterium]|nr:hypothetical protein [Gammaproteobacteria bacterium]